MNKYEVWYHALIASRQKRPEIVGYYEKHHIIPKAFGGSDEKSNLVKLTYREHFLAHWLLARANVGWKRFWMARALCLMEASSQYRNRFRLGWHHGIVLQVSYNSRLIKPELIPKHLRWFDRKIRLRCLKLLDADVLAGLSIEAFVEKRVKTKEFTGCFREEELQFLATTLIKNAENRL